MTHDLIVWFFGAAAWGAACNLPAWARLLWERWGERTTPFRDDAYLKVRAGLVFAAIAVGAVTWLRASSFMEFPKIQPPQVLSFFGYKLLDLPEWGPALWVVPMTVAEVLFLSSASTIARRQGRKPLAMRVFLIGMALWTPFVAIMHP